MAVRIIAIVIVVALGIFVVYQQLSVNKPTRGLEDDKEVPFTAQREGVEPPTRPEFDVGIELVREGPKQLIQFTVTERHGWFADTIYVEYWYEEPDEDGQWHRVGNSIEFLCRKYLDFGSTLVDRTVLYDVEFPELESFGTVENWRARVTRYGTVLAPKG